jgi:hypothetical protein
VRDETGSYLRHWTTRSSRKAAFTSYVIINDDGKICDLFSLQAAFNSELLLIWIFIPNAVSFPVNYPIAAAGWFKSLFW